MAAKDLVPDRDPAFLRHVLDCVGDGVAAVDLRGIIVYLNPAARLVFGSIGVGQPIDAWWEVAAAYHSDEVTPFARDDLPLARALRGESCEDVEVFLRGGAETQARMMSVTARPLLDSAGAQMGAVAAFREIGVRTQLAGKLRASQRFLESVLECVPAMIFVKDAEELRFHSFNRAGEELLGLTRDALIGKNDYDFFPKRQADFFTQVDRDTLAAGTIRDIPEEPIETPSGTRWLHTRKVPILDDAGRPQYLLGISEDITERKAALAALEHAYADMEQRVRERTQELEQANDGLRQEATERKKAQEALTRSEAQLRQAQKMEAVGRLAGGVAHDFNNMLTAILSFSSMILDAIAADAPIRADVEQIAVAGERAATLTRQLLAFSRQQILQPVVLDLGQVVRGMEGMVRRLIGEDIELRTLSAIGLGRVMADRSQIEQVILNLAVNARDAMPHGGQLTIELSNLDLTGPLAGEHATLPSGAYILLAVSDTGVGMSREALAHVFEPFFTTKPRGQGTGLGLSTCYGIVRQSGGDLTVYSEPNRGTTFKIYLPRVSAEQPVATPGIRLTSPAGMGRCVLVVEDEELVRSATCKILLARGYEVLEAASPAAALELCAAHPEPIQLLLTDVVMPGMNGPEMAEQLRKLRPNLAVLYMSGYTDATIMNHGVTGGRIAFLPKPFTPDSLAAKVAEVLAAVSGGGGG